MKAYSVDPRERVAAARDDGMGTAEVAELFGCCRSWVRRPMQRRRDRGTVEPLARAAPDGGTDTDLVVASVRDEPVPALRPGPVVVMVMDNLNPRKAPEVRRLVEAAGARVMLLPPYSPDLNPTDNAFAKVKAILRPLARRTAPVLYDAIGDALRAITPGDAAGFFRHCGYPAI